MKALGNRAHGRAQARWIIDHVDAGCASPGEARLLYELCVAGLTGMQTQVEVHTHGHRYFIDCAFLAERIGIEFDGRAKYGETPSSIHASLARERERQRHLEAEAGTSSGSAGATSNTRPSSSHRFAPRSPPATG